MKIIQYIKHFFLKEQRKEHSIIKFGGLTLQEIDNRWNELKTMPDNRIVQIIKTIQRDDLDIALVHSDNIIINRFRNMIKDSNVFECLMKKHSTSSKIDGYRMKAHIIHTAFRPSSHL